MSDKRFKVYHKGPAFVVYDSESGQIREDKRFQDLASAQKHVAKLNLKDEADKAKAKADAEKAESKTEEKPEEGGKETKDNDKPEGEA